MAGPGVERELHHIQLVSKNSGMTHIFTLLVCVGHVKFNFLSGYMLVIAAGHASWSRQVCGYWGYGGGWLESCWYSLTAIGVLVIQKKQESVPPVRCITCLFVNYCMSMNMYSITAKYMTELIFVPCTKYCQRTGPIADCTISFDSSVMRHMSQWWWAMPAKHWNICLYLYPVTATKISDPKV